MLDKIIFFLKKEDNYDIFFWGFVLYFYFLNFSIYIFIVDILILIKLLININKKRFSIDKKYFLLFFIFFIASSLQIYFFKIKSNPFLFSSLILLLILFSFSGIRFENLKIPLLFLPFISIIHYFINHQQEASFIYKHSSILGILLIFGFILFKENLIMNIVYIISIFFTFSKTSYIALLLLLIILLYKHYNRKKIGLIFVLPLIFFIVFFGISFRSSVKNDLFVKGRLTIWRTAFNTAINNLPFGVGGFNFNYYSDQYKPIELKNIDEKLGFYIDFLNDRIDLDVYNTKRVRYEHNIFLKLFAEYGLIGLIFIILLLILIIKDLKYYSFTQKLLLFVFFLFSLIQNFTLSYVFILPFISVISEKDRENKNFYFDKKIIISGFIIYFFIFSLPVFINQYLLNKGSCYTKKVFPFDLGYDYYNFKKAFNGYKIEKDLKTLLLLEREGERIIAYNNRIKELYSTLAYAFVNSYYSTDNDFLRKKAVFYLSKLAELEPYNPFVIRELAEISLRMKLFDKSKYYIFKTLKIEPFYISGLKTLKKIYTIEDKKEMIKIIDKTLNKIIKEKKNIILKEARLMRGTYLMKDKKELIIYFLLLFIIVSGIYFKSLNSALIWDSRLQIEKNILIVENSSPLEAFKYGFWEPMGYSLEGKDYYRPLTIVSFILNKKMLGNSNISYKAVNLFLFYIILIILYFYLRSQNEQKYFAEITTLIFALFPLNIDNVVWVVGRCDLFMILFGLISLSLLEKFIRNKNKKYLVFSSVFFLIALFSKESSVFFLPFFFIYEFLKRKKLTVWYHILNTISVGLLFFAKFSVNGPGGVKFNLFHPFLKNIYVLFGTAGYYFKSVLLPYNFNMFVFLENITRLEYIIWGLLFFTILLFLLLRAIKKDILLRIPLLFVLNFLPFYILFAYSNLYPYSISTRYVIIPAIGLLWIGVKYILKIKNRLKYYLLIFILFSFSFSTVYNSLYYKSPKLFWGKIYKKNPNLSFIGAVYANSLFKEKQFIKGESILKRALKNRMKEYTAVFIGTLFANLEYQKAEYDKVLLWIKRVKNLRIDNLNKTEIYKVRADIQSAKGNFVKSEKILKDAIHKLKFTNIFYYKLLELYIGYERWDRANSFVKKHRNIFKDSVNIEDVKKKFDSFSPLQKLNFFIKHKNYKKAIEIFKIIKTDSVKDNLFLAELYYRAGDDKKGNRTIKNLFFKYKNNYKIINSIAEFYLVKLSRVSEAINYFKYSLKIKPDQQKVKNIINILGKSF